MVAVAKGKVSEQKQAEITKQNLMRKQQQNIKLSQSLDVTIKENKNIIKVCKWYLAKKRDVSFREIKRGIELANAIIPEAQNYHLNISDKKASIENEYNHDLYDAEGSAYASILSFNLRSVIIDNTPILNFLLLDEIFSTLSPESSANFSKILPELAKKFLIVLIEQKPEIFVTGVDKKYLVTKNGDRTEVTVVKENTNV